MQVNAPDFFAPTNGRTAAKEDHRPGDGLFDALLREEETRYAREPLPPRAPERPADDGRTVAEPDRREDTYDTAAEYPAEERAREPEERAEAIPAERAPQPTDTPPDDQAAARGTEAAASEETPAQAGQAQQAAAAGPSAEPQVGATGATPAAPTGAAAKQGGQAPAAPAPQLAAVAATPPATGAQSASSPPSAEAATATPASGAQPASAAASAQRAADKATSGAVAKDTTETTAGRRPSPTAAQRAGGERAVTPADVTAAGSATIEARPSAALGGGAAAAALAQTAENQAKAGAGAETAAAAPVNGQSTAAEKPAGQAQQSAKPAETTGLANKPAERPAGAPAATAEPALGHASQSTATPPLAAAGVGGTAAVHTASFAETLTQARHAPANPAEQIALQVHRAQVAGQDQINIKLHPAELGRIEVKLENASDGTLRAVISAERPETLDLLQRDARGLERALQEAGVKTDSGSLSFNLRGQGQQHEQQAGGNGGSGRPSADARSQSGEPLPAQAQAYRSSHSGSLDIRV